MIRNHFDQKKTLIKILLLTWIFIISIFSLVFICWTNSANANMINDKDTFLILSGNGGKFALDYFEDDELDGRLTEQVPVHIEGDWVNGDNAYEFFKDVGLYPSFINVSQWFSMPEVKVLTFYSIDENATLNIYQGNCRVSEYWTSPEIGEIPTDGNKQIDPYQTYNFIAPFTDNYFDVRGTVRNVNDAEQPVPGAFVQYCQWNPWFWNYVPVPEMSTFTDWFGNYTIEGVTEDMLPGVIRVYRFDYEVGESWPIWGAPEGEDTVYRFIQMTPAEPPVPPVPPTPPDPPVPPQPDPPQPVPPTPVPPTPVDPGTNIPQTGDTASFACAIFAILALCGTCSFAACAKSRRRSK